MLNLLDASIEAFLRVEVPLPARDVDIAFEAPDRDWSAGVTKPTVNLYLWDVRRNLDEREAGRQMVEEAGRRVRRQPHPRVECRYLVTAWATETEDEHALLGAVLTTLLQHDEIAPDHLQGAYAPVRPLPSLAVAAADGRDHSDVWSALGGQLKPGLDLVVTATVDAAAGAEVGPPVERYEVVVGDPGDADRRSRRRFVAGTVDGDDVEGARARTRRGSRVVAADGTFLVPAESDDEVVIDRDEPRSKPASEQGSARGRGR